MIDILFTLIIFFLVTTTFEEKEKEEEVRLPKQGGSSLVNKDRPIYINVLQDGSYSVGGDVVNLNDLEFKLKVRFEEKPDQKLVLRGIPKPFTVKSLPHWISPGASASAKPALPTTPVP